MLRAWSGDHGRDGAGDEGAGCGCGGLGGVDGG